MGLVITRLVLALALLQAPFLLWALPLMGQYVTSGFNPGSTSSQTVNIGLPLNDGGNDSGNTNIIEFLPILTPPGSSSTVSSISVWWGAVTSNTWGVALYANSSNSPGSLLCSSVVTSTPSSGFNSRSPAGCGTLTANTIYWLAQITGSATLQNGRLTSNGTYCSASGLGALQDSSAQGSTTFPASGATGTPTAYSGCPNMYITLACSSSCGATLEYYTESLPSPTTNTTFSYTTSILSGDTHRIALVAVQMDGNTGSHAMSCTLGGNSMTQVVAPVSGTGGTLFGSVFILVNPPTGNQSVSCTSSASGADWFILTAVFSGINQTGTVGNTWRAAPDTAVDPGGSSNSPATITLAAAHTATNDIVFNWISFDILSETSNGPASKTGVYQVMGPTFSSNQVGLQITGGTGSSLTMSWPFLPITGTWSSAAFALIPG